MIPSSVIMEGKLRTVPGASNVGDQSQKSYDKWSHCGNDHDLMNGARTCIFNPDGVFGIHMYSCLCCDTLLFDSKEKFESHTAVIHAADRGQRHCLPTNRPFSSESRPSAIRVRRIWVTCFRTVRNLVGYATA